MHRQDFFNRLLPSKLTPDQSGQAYAPSNIALSKYWGKRNHELNLPTNGSLSISLAHLGTHTQLTLSDDHQDHIILNNIEQAITTPFAQKIITFCNYFRRQQHIPLTIHTTNTIPTAAGLASSASGFAALTLALDQFFALSLPKTTLSAIARIGSGSACRSLWHGFVQWPKGHLADGSDSIGKPLDVAWSAFRIALLEVDTNVKKISSRDGMTHTADTSPLFSLWPAQAEKDLQTICQAITCQDFSVLGQTTENNALTMHATMLAARPSLIYIQPQTLSLLHNIQRLRNDGVEVYATIDAGPNIKVIFLQSQQDDIKAALSPSIVIEPFAHHKYNYT
ncbi:MAG: diphosphomevalonate decarboxylase [Cardiobacteriales bacterium]|nr:MAG: diphosphomevalonate decarboxylase [Cardiobacteriales bacterium]